jgi:hypothetical protein
MGNKGGKVDGSGEKIISVRIVTDTIADTGIGSPADPIRTDPTGTTVQPVSFPSAQHVIVDSGGGSGGGNAAASSTGAAVPASAGYTGFNSGGNLVGVSSASPLPVTVNNFPATQPVSGAVSVSNLPATQPVSGTVAVSNLPVTQPVSGTVAVSNFPATQPVSIASMPSTPVTGTFFQATQPVSLAAETTKVIGTVNVAAAQTIAVTQATPANLQATVTPITLTKGTQGATGFSTQDLKDAGRVLCTFTASAVAGVTTEGLITLTPYKDLVAGSTGTTFAVTAGKRLRIQSIAVTWRNNTAAAGGVTVRLRLLAGTVLVGSPVHGSLNATTALATIGSGATSFMNIPDGLELSGTMQFGLTQLAVGAVVGFDVHVTGYEY